AGATIMGDGRVALILDVIGLAQRAGVLSDDRDPATVEHAEPAAAQQDARQALLLVAGGDGGRLAIPLSAVAPLEGVARDAGERAGGRQVVQYRGRILPLVRLADVLGGGHEDADRPLQVVVYTERGRSVGLVVDGVVDIVEETVALERGGGRPGVA